MHLSQPRHVSLEEMARQGGAWRRSLDVLSQLRHHESLSAALSLAKLLSRSVAWVRSVATHSFSVQSPATRLWSLLDDFTQLTLNFP